MAERNRLVKLVRDDVGKWLEDPAIEYRPVPREQHVALLREKLMEEATEYLLRPSVGELADVLEAVRALATVDLELGGSLEAAGIMGLSGRDLEFLGDRGLVLVAREAKLKRDERGGFIGGVGMYASSNASPRHEGEHGRG